ncbi:hypothetical protein AHF37_12125 [Paragonimus kellicotti]|nr:hypothetical protein AHF37_12125 [Paragonimus kellicotti]
MGQDTDKQPELLTVAVCVPLTDDWSPRSPVNFPTGLLQPNLSDTDWLPRRIFIQTSALSASKGSLVGNSEWLAQTSEAAFRAFERGAVLATKLRDGHLLKTCATCFWNHCLPAICGADHRQLVGTIKVLLECAGKLGFSCLTLELYAALTII